MGQSASRVSDPAVRCTPNLLFNAKQLVESGTQRTFRLCHALFGSQEEAKMVMSKLAPSGDGGRLSNEAKLARLRELSDFAQRYSRCSSGPRGGDLGWVRSGSLMEEMEVAIETIPVGGLAMVQTRFGWHVVLKEDQIEHGKVKDMEVDDTLRALSSAVSSKPWTGPRVVPENVDDRIDRPSGKLPKLRTFEKREEPEPVPGQLTEKQLLALFRTVRKDAETRRLWETEGIRELGIDRNTVIHLLSFYDPLLKEEET